MKKILSLLYNLERIVTIFYQRILESTLIFSRNKKSDFKVFCVGHPKTGTTSLAAALKILGFRTLDWPRAYIEPRKGWMDYFKKSKFDAFTDAPLNETSLLKEFDKVFPNSKFILTIRDEDLFIKSWKTFFYGTSYSIDTKEYEEYIRKFYNDHNKYVLDYFKKDSSRLLVIDIFEDDNWSKLCNFLGCKKPDVPFPHKNKNHYRKLIIKKFFLK